MATKAKEASSDVLKVYELGTHIISSLPEEEVAAAYASLKDVIIKAGGLIVSEEAPKLMDLAYVMVKHAHGKNVRHSTAHFSWIKFEIDPSVIPSIHDAVSKDENVLRFIIVKTVKENTLHGDKFPAEVKEDKRGGRREKPQATEAAAEKPVETAATE